MIFNRFYLLWIAANLVGFVIGSVLGATSNGLLPGLIPGYIGLLVGDLIFGFSFGLAQWLVLRGANIPVVFSWWVLASSIGFMLGARSGSFLTHRFANEWFPPQVIFGFLMGGWIGLSTAIPLRKLMSRPHLIGWIAVSLTAWIIGESIAFAADFAHTAVPLVAVSISSLTGFFLVLIRGGKPVISRSALSKNKQYPLKD